MRANDSTILGAPPSIAIWAGLHLPIVVALFTAHITSVLVGAVVVLGAGVVALWRGSRIAWVAWLALTAAAVVTQPLDPVAWWAFALNVVSLVLLLVPTTQVYVWGRVRVLDGLSSRRPRP